jgi:glycosyl transferase, family 25
MHVYIINLARSPDRREYMVTQLVNTGLSYEVVDGIDGRRLDFDNSETARLVAPSVLVDKSLLAGEIGCAMSHLRVYEKILSDGHDYALVLEDDVTLPRDLASLVEEIAQSLSGAEVVLLNFDSTGPVQLARSEMIDLKTNRALVLPIDGNQILSAAAYMVTREACLRLVKGLLPISAKADEWAIRFNAGMIDRMRCIVPIAVTKSSVFPSTMDYNPRGSIKARILEFVARYDFGGAQKLMAYRRRRIWRRMTVFELSDAPFVNKPSRL